MRENYARISERMTYMFFGKKKEEPAVQPPVETPAIQQEPEEPEVKEPEKNVPINRTTIGAGITFFGDFETADPIDINGSLIGNIKSSSSVNVSQGASMRGDATMKELSSQGSINGNLVVEELSSFSETAVTDGTLRTRFLDSGRGSSFLGTLELSGNKAEEKPAAESAPEADGFAAESAEGSFDADAFAQAAEELQGFVSEAPAQEAPAEGEFNWNPGDGSEQNG